MKKDNETPSFPSLVQRFFCERLTNQRNASPRTIQAYRDTFCLLLTYLQKRLRVSPSDLTLWDLDAPNIVAFLDYLENERQNSIRTRNARRAAIRSFLTYAAFHDPAALPVIQRVQAIPSKRCAHPLPEFLSRDEIEAVLGACDVSTWTGERDQVMLTTLYNTGARVSEIAGLRIGDVSLDGSASVTIQGKGRKQREVPLWKNTARLLRSWCKKISPSVGAPLFPNAHGQPLTRSGVQGRLKKAVQRAAKTCPSLRDRQISPHVIRHTTAMHLLQAGVDITVIALFLGHESITTTHSYMKADLPMKEKALGLIQEPGAQPSRYTPNDTLLKFLEAL